MCTKAYPDTDAHKYKHVHRHIQARKTLSHRRMLSPPLPHLPGSAIQTKLEPDQVPGPSYTFPGVRGQHKVGVSSQDAGRAKACIQAVNGQEDHKEEGLKGQEEGTGWEGRGTGRGGGKTRGEEGGWDKEKGGWVRRRNRMGRKKVGI